MGISPKIRRKRLRKLASKIVKHEKQFDMRSYFQDNTDLSGEEVIEKITEKRRPMCGTAGCAAAWAVFMFGSKKQIANCIKTDEKWDDIAQKLLGMTDDETAIFNYVSDDAEDIARDLRDMSNA